MQRIIKKGDCGLYQSPLAAFWLLLRGEFTPSTSNVASLRAERFPTAEEEQSGARNEGDVVSRAEKAWALGHCAAPRGGERSGAAGVGQRAQKLASPVLRAVGGSRAAWRRRRSLQMKHACVRRL
uniref:Uncharacterized protein n=1 Tax=Rangifer tarandus platyrhynchus TaxID=3082113 RepID=A0ACB0DY55_RANTA|nr:unnamed protein product [Rangifer tarandus platyrhynchus]